jgi:hypothetical protein
MKKKNNTKPSSVRSAEVVSRLKTNEGTEIISMEKVKNIITEHQACIESYAAIIHDKDTYTAEDEKSNPEHKAGELKPAHIHVMMKFKHNNPQHIGYIAKWFGVAENFVEKIQGTWADAIAYLIHANAKEKYQYDPEEVEANFDISTAINDSKDSTGYFKYVRAIMNGEILEYEKFDSIPDLILIAYSRQIEKAFENYIQKLSLMAEDRFDMTVIYIHGKSQAGKTTLAKKIAKEKGLKAFVTSSSNDPFDGYMMQPAIIADDLRPDTMAFADLLKLLDKNTASSVKSRYKNKLLVCKYIIITSILSIDEFLKRAFEFSHEEPGEQLKRRCENYIEMTNETINYYKWDTNLERFSPSATAVNDIVKPYIPAQPLTQEDVEKHMYELMPFLSKHKKESNFTMVEEMPKTEQMKLDIPSDWVA